MDKIDRERDRINGMSFEEFCALVRLDPRTVQNRLDSYGDIMASQIASLRGIDIKRVVQRLRELTEKDGFEARIPSDLFPECPTPSKLPCVYPRIVINYF
jgi:hypothetical protein